MRTIIAWLLLVTAVSCSLLAVCLYYITGQDALSDHLAKTALVLLVICAGYNYVFKPER